MKAAIVLREVLQHRYDRAMVDATKAVHRLNKANSLLADAANALNEYDSKMAEYGKGKRTNDTGKNSSPEHPEGS